MNNELLQKFIDNIRRCNCDKIHMVPPAFMHAIVGMGDEMGELMEILKRALYYGDKIDNAHLIEEYGDVLFYVMLDCMRIAEDWNLDSEMVFETVLVRNISKLKERYPEGFSEAKATESGRDREAEWEAMGKSSPQRDDSKTPKQSTSLGELESLNHHPSTDRPQRAHPRDPGAKPHV